jgi:hypothetical protein
MAPPMLALFTEAGAAVTGQRFIAVEWDERLGIDPAAQPHALAAWPQLAKPFSKMRQRAWRASRKSGLLFDRGVSIYIANSNCYWLDKQTQTPSFLSAELKGVVSH